MIKRFDLGFTDYNSVTFDPAVNGDYCYYDDYEELQLELDQTTARCARLEYSGGLLACYVAGTRRLDDEGPRAFILGWVDSRDSTPKSSLAAVKAELLRTAATWATHPSGTVSVKRLLDEADKLEGK